MAGTEPLNEEAVSHTSGPVEDEMVWIKNKKICKKNLVVQI